MAVTLTGRARTKLKQWISIFPANIQPGKISKKKKKKKTRGIYSWRRVCYRRQSQLAGKMPDIERLRAFIAVLSTTDTGWDNGGGVCVGDTASLWPGLVPRHTRRKRCASLSCLKADEYAVDTQLDLCRRRGAEAHWHSTVLMLPNNTKRKDTRRYMQLWADCTIKRII